MIGGFGCAKYLSKLLRDVLNFLKFINNIRKHCNANYIKYRKILNYIIYSLKGNKNA